MLGKTRPERGPSGTRVAHPASWAQGGPTGTAECGQRLPKVSFDAVSVHQFCLAVPLWRLVGCTPQVETHLVLLCRVHRSVNEVICHGIPDLRPFQNGDIVNLDVTVYHRGHHSDLNETYLIGDVDEASVKLVETAYACLAAAVAMGTRGAPGWVTLLAGDVTRSPACVGPHFSV